jgi:hypothetical protein
MEQWSYERDLKPDLIATQGCGGSRATVRGVRGVQFPCERAAGKYLRSEKGG